MTRPATPLLDRVTVPQFRVLVILSTAGEPVRNRDLAEALGITTVGQPFRRTGVEAVGLLLSRLEGYAGPPREVMLQPEFVPGATS